MKIVLPHLDDLDDPGEVWAEVADRLLTAVRRPATETYHSCTGQVA